MLTYEQVRISLLQFYYKDKPIYNIYFELNIKKQFDIKLFERCINYMIINQKNLQTNVIIKNDKLEIQYNKRKFKLIELDDINLINKEINKPFDISNDLLFKFILNKKINKLYCIFHDLIIDGNTVIIFFKELETFYNNLLNNTITKITNQEIKENEYYKLNFWEKQIENNLCNKWMVKENINNNDEARIKFIIDKRELDNINFIKKRLNITLFDYITSIIHLLIRNITNDKIIYTDTIFSGNESKIGLYNKVVILKNSLVTNNISLEEYIVEYSKYLLEVKNNIVPLELLVYQLSKNKNLINIPNVRIHFEYFNKTMKKYINLGDSKLSSDFVENSSDTIRQLLIFNICECSDIIECYISFKKDCFDISYIEYLIDSFKKIINYDLDSNIKEITCGNKKYYNTIYKEEINKRFEAYRLAGSYPNVKYSEFKKRLDYFV